MDFTKIARDITGWNWVSRYRAQRSAKLEEQAEKERLGRLAGELFAALKENNRRPTYLGANQLASEGIASFEQAVIGIAAFPLGKRRYRLFFLLDKPIPGIGGPNLLVGDYPAELYNVLEEKKLGGFIIDNVSANLDLSEKEANVALTNSRGVHILYQFARILDPLFNSPDRVLPLHGQDRNSLAGRYRRTWDAEYAGRIKPDRPPLDAAANLETGIVAAGCSTSPYTL